MFKNSASSQSSLSSERFTRVQTHTIKTNRIPSTGLAVYQPATCQPTRRLYPIKANSSTRTKLHAQGKSDDAVLGALEQSEEYGIGDEEGIAGLPRSVNFKQCVDLGNALNLREAVSRLTEELELQVSNLEKFQSGIFRFEVTIPRTESALSWLRRQEKLRQQFFSFYLNSRERFVQGSVRSKKTELENNKLGIVSCIGTTWIWKGQPGSEPNAQAFEELNCFLDPQFPNIRCMGGVRFDCQSIPSSEWTAFGSCVFFLPAVEYHEHSQEATLACTVAWKPSGQNTGSVTAQDSIQKVLRVLGNISTTPSPICLPPSDEKLLERSCPSWEEYKTIIDEATSELTHVPGIESVAWHLEQNSAFQEYLATGQQGLDSLLMSLTSPVDVVDDDEKEVFAKVVLVRRTELSFKAKLDPYRLLNHLQKLDPTSYQFCLSLPHEGGTFLGSTPERLYARNGGEVTTEALAGSRPRGSKGDLKEDFQLGLDLLMNPKDHVEFVLVRNWLAETLQKVCSNVQVDIPKTLVKKQRIQHLYGRLCGTLKSGRSDFELLKNLHPTPAVCGRPTIEAKEKISVVEEFDRGLFAGPIGWISGIGAEFAVAIRSALIPASTPSNESPIYLYAGSGILKASIVESEWKELDLKISPFTHQLRFWPSPLTSAPNINYKMATMIIEELFRCGVHYFDIAPGSRSSPLAFAAAQHPRCQTLTCIDERSLGFWSLGFGKASGKIAPLITTSGTAVSNLLPSVIEANLSQIPMVLLTADRPAFLRQTGSNQTIDQVKIFGDYVHLFHDIPPPTEDPIKWRALLTLIDSAVRFATNEASSGPVHLNLQMEEPLSPRNEEFANTTDAVLDNWWKSGSPFTETVASESWTEIQNLDLTAVEQGLLVVGELSRSEDKIAVQELSSLLGWPAVVDILSGLKIARQNFILTADQILGEESVLLKEKLRPDCIVQIGGHLTSKRVVQFLERCRLQNPEIEWIYVSPDSRRDDPQHLITKKITSSVSSLVKNLPRKIPRPSGFLQLWKSADEAVIQTLDRQMRYLGVEEVISEPYVAHIVSKKLPKDHGLFLGNGMPVRDMEMFSGISQAADKDSPLRGVGSNRGASGIDGVISTAIGYAHGLSRPLTLLIGDVSFLHDLNGLGLLRNTSWPPMTIVVINNEGGGIFDFLPIAQDVSSDVFNELWSTPQDIDIPTLCQAFRVSHQRITKSNELEAALEIAWTSHQHSIVEVITERKDNLSIHRKLKKVSAQAAERVVRLREMRSDLQILDMQWTQYELPLKQPLTSDSSVNFRSGVHLQITINVDGEIWKGYGEIAPLPGLHTETLDEIYPQLRLLRSLVLTQEIPVSVVERNEGLDEWLMDAFGIEKEDLSPSLSFGFDCALYSAIAQSLQLPLHQLFTLEESPDKASLPVNGLLSLSNNLQDNISKALEMEREGFRAIKIKVGRQEDPIEEASMINEISKTLSKDIRIRLDANCAWSLSKALSFASILQCPQLEYIEEPLADLSQLEHFSHHTRLPIALDDSLQSIRNPQELVKFLRRNQAIEVCVWKPTMVGSFSKLFSFLEVCSSLDVKCILTSTFESPIGLSLLAQLSQINNTLYWSNAEDTNVPYHGLRTLSWFSSPPAEWKCLLKSEVPLQESWRVLQTYSFEKQWSSEMKSFVQTVFSPLGNYYYYIRRIGYQPDIPKPTVLFLHGFLGSNEDWLPVVEYLADGYDCLVVDLPGHGLTEIDGESMELFHFEKVVFSLKSLLKKLKISQCGVVGYSMGGRVAAALTILATDIQISPVVMVSSNFGFTDVKKRRSRFEEDKEKAEMMMETENLENFLQRWYTTNNLWTPLRRHRRLFQKIFRLRLENGNVYNFGKTLVGMSTGRMSWLKPDLVRRGVEVVFVYGEEDVKIGRNVAELSEDGWEELKIMKVGNCGHAVHLEAPLKLSKILRCYL